MCGNSGNLIQELWVWSLPLQGGEVRAVSHCSGDDAFSFGLLEENVQPVAEAGVGLHWSAGLGSPVFSASCSYSGADPTTL